MPMRLLLLLAACGAAAAGSCKDHNNEDVAWWVAYSPARSDYALFLSSTGTASTEPIFLKHWLTARQSGHHDATVHSPMWATIKSFGDFAQRMAYNDQGQSKYKQTDYTLGHRGAHAKGLVYAEGPNIVWIQHSCPKFNGTMQSVAENSCECKAQHYACFTMPTEKDGRDIEKELIDHLWFANVLPVTDPVPEDWDEWNRKLIGRGEERKAKTPHLRGVRANTFPTKDRELTLRVSACGFYCEAAMRTAGFRVRPNRMHCRLYDRLAASKRYRGKHFLVRSWDREVDGSAQRQFNKAKTNLDCSMKWFPVGSETPIARGAGARARNIVESVGGWAMSTTVFPEEESAEDDDRLLGGQLEFMSWKRGGGTDHSKVMVSTDESVACLFDVNHYQARAGTATCLENDAIARFWGTLMYPPPPGLMNKGPEDTQPDLYYPAEAEVDMRFKLRSNGRSEAEVDREPLREKFIAHSSSDELFQTCQDEDATSTGGSSGRVDATRPPHDVCDVLDAENLQVQEPELNELPRCQTLAPNAPTEGPATPSAGRSADDGAASSQVIQPAAGGAASGPPSDGGECANTDDVPELTTSPCTSLKTLLTMAKPSAVRAGWEMYADKNYCVGVPKEIRKTGLRFIMSKEDFLEEARQSVCRKAWSRHVKLSETVEEALAEEYEKRTQPCNCEVPEEACEDSTDEEEDDEEEDDEEEDDEAAAADGEFVDKREQTKRIREREQLKPLIGYEKRVRKLRPLQRCYDSAFKELVDDVVRSESPRLTEEEFETIIRQYRPHIIKESAAEVFRRAYEEDDIGLRGSCKSGSDPSPVRHKAFQNLANSVKQIDFEEESDSNEDSYSEEDSDSDFEPPKTKRQRVHKL